MNLIGIKHVNNYEYNILLKSEKEILLLNTELQEWSNLCIEQITQIIQKDIESINTNVNYDHAYSIHGKSYANIFARRELYICTKDETQVIFNIISQNNISEEDLLEYLIDF